MNEDAIDRKLVCAFIAGLISDDVEREKGLEYIRNMPPVTPQPKIGWNNHQIACMLADLFGDVCACNYNGIDKWLGELCDFKDTCCPNPVGVACWEQFLKYLQSRYTECGYEVRDKNAMQEPKTGHWIETAEEYYKAVNEYGGGVNENTPYFVDDIACSECLAKYSVIDNETERFDHCPSCGAKMVEPQESEE
ncbi:MAG: hypothetical protein II240_01780 [Bacteroidaceae bacterium]|nr:hypothetical protein [Bacteroidaceae bacterium]